MVVGSFFASNFAIAEEKTIIIASVGDDAITNQDLLHRIKIIIISSGAQGDPETVAKIKPIAIEELIDEKMYLAEAKRLNYVIDDKQLDDALLTLEKQNNMAAGTLTKMMLANQVPVEALRTRISGEIAKAFLLAHEVKAKISVSDEEIGDYIRAENQVVQRDEYFMHEIVLPVDLPADDQKQLDLANSLMDKLSKSTSKDIDFALLAKQFSASPSAKNGGAVGWLNKNQIPREIFAAIKAAQAGAIAGPIRSAEGYYLVKIAEKRTVNNAAERDIVNVNQFYQMPKSEKEVDVVMAKIASLDKPIEACRKPEGFAASKKLGVKEFGRSKVGKLPPAVKKIISGLVTAKFSPPVNSPDGIASFIICERIQLAPDDVSDEEKEQARQVLEGKKTEIEANKYKRLLRLKTNVDVRL